MQNREREAGSVGGGSGCCRRLVQAFVLALLASGWFTALPAGAAIVFDFNSIALSGSASNGLGATASSATIQSYMTTALQTQSGNSNASVAVTGALATKTYNGENHVVGQTLGTSDGGVAHSAPNDTFIVNNNFGLYGGTASNYFTLVLSNYLVSSISFDYEIFPDASCAAGSTCAKSNQTNANWPDMKVLAGTSTSSLTEYWNKLAPVPGNSTTDPQALGTMTLYFPSPVSVIRFSDWPAEIGIDNLKLTTNRVPEPGTLPLLGLVAVAGFLMAQRRGRGRARGSRLVRVA